MLPFSISKSLSGYSLASILASVIFIQSSNAANIPRRSFGYNTEDPFAVLDPQEWVNPADMTWDDWKAPPGTNWSDPTRTGSSRNFKIALVTVDYSDKPFEITLPVNSTVFGNPQPAASDLKLSRDDVPAFYRDFLNKPSDLNHGHTLHEYWMGDSEGRFGVDLTVFGAYKMPLKSYQYGLDTWMNEGECPPDETCDIDLRTDSLGAWRADIGDEAADSYELVFILSAGQDESSTWQEFGEMKFQTKEDVTDAFGPPGNITIKNWAKTRYVEWTSWASASCIWPNAGGGSSTQAESSGMATYAHELSHLLGIGDNYNNPYGVPLRRAYTGPWSMLSRGSFNGPGGPHTRWQIPPQQGGSLGSLHTMRDKAQIGLVGNESLVHLSREVLSNSGLVVARLTARAVAPGANELMGLRIAMDSDRSPYCNISTEVLCDGGGFNGYEMEGAYHFHVSIEDVKVKLGCLPSTPGPMKLTDDSPISKRLANYPIVIDRMGADSFTPDSGLMISKSKIDSDGGLFQWTIDANPQDIKLLDFYRPNGTAAYITLGDYRQLADALFHAGTRSGSEYEYVDKANSLHFYIIGVNRDTTGVLSYTAAVRSLDTIKGGKKGVTGPHKYRASLGWGKVISGRNSPTKKGITCSFKLSNTGTYSKAAGQASHPQDVSTYLKSDVYRLKASVKGHGWKVELPNALATAKFGSYVTVQVAVAAESSASIGAVVKLVATSESDPSAVATGQCWVNKYINL